MSKQTEAERLADLVERHPSDDVELVRAAAELRRQASFINDLKDEVVEQCRINGMSAEREDALRAEVERLKKAPDYAWPTIEDYEKEVGFEVNIAFRSAWTVARTTNDLFKQMGSDT